MNRERTALGQVADCWRAFLASDNAMPAKFESRGSAPSNRFGALCSKSAYNSKPTETASLEPWNHDDPFHPLVSIATTPNGVNRALVGIVDIDGKSFVCVSVRGTDQWQNWLQNIQTKQTPYCNTINANASESLSETKGEVEINDEAKDVMVHEGFKGALDALLKADGGKLLKTVEEYQSKESVADTLLVHLFDQPYVYISIHIYIYIYIYIYIRGPL